MTSLVTTLRISPGNHKVDTDRVPTNLSPSILMIFSKILTSTATTGMPVTEDTSMNTQDPTKIHTAVTRDTFMEVLEQVSLRTCLKTQRKCLPSTDTPNRRKTDFMVLRNNTVEQ